MILLELISNKKYFLLCFGKEKEKEKDGRGLWCRNKGSAKDYAVVETQACML